MFSERVIGGTLPGAQFAQPWADVPFYKIEPSSNDFDETRAYIKKLLMRFLMRDCPGWIFGHFVTFVLILGLYLFYSDVFNAFAPFCSTVAPARISHKFSDEMEKTSRWQIQDVVFKNEATTTGAISILDHMIQTHRRIIKKANDSLPDEA